MKDYNIVVNFQDGSIESNFMELVQNDYNTTTLNFKFDTDNRVLFKMLYPDNETEYIIDIENNQLVLGPGILSQDGIYKIELASYPTDGRVTAYATMEFYVRKELIGTDEIVEPDDRVPILDNLINEVDNINISATKEDDVATITVTKKDGTTDTVEIYDGEIGPQGPKGDKGDKGDTGERGPQGIQGPKGDTGPQGAKGDKGDKGDTGSQGPIGPTGPTGPQGSQGPKGDKGDTGSQGPTGPQGPQGPKGDPGLTEQEVQDMIDTSIEALGEIGFTPTVVEELPTHDIDEHTIYLVPKEDEETDDVYDEWLYISNNWEHVGSTSVDLSNYYTKDNIYGVPTFVVDFKGVDFQNGGTIYNNEVKQQCEDAMNFFASKQTTYGRLILINCGGGEKVLELTNTTRSLTARTTASYRFDTISTYTRLNTDADANRKFSIKGITINGSWNGDVFTIAQNGANKIAIEYNMENYLAKNNNVSYTPSSDYNPATKKYVDDNLPDMSDYYTKSEVDQKDVIYSLTIAGGWSVTSEETAALEAIINDCAEKETCIIKCIFTYYNATVLMHLMNNIDTSITSIVSYQFTGTDDKYSINSTNIYDEYKLRITGTWTDGNFTATGGTTFTKEIKDFMRPQVTCNVSAFHTYTALPRSTQTPTRDDEFTTKKYVDTVSNIIPTLVLSDVPTRSWSGGGLTDSNLLAFFSARINAMLTENPQNGLALIKYSNSSKTELWCCSTNVSTSTTQYDYYLVNKNAMIGNGSMSNDYCYAVRGRWSDGVYECTYIATFRNPAPFPSSNQVLTKTNNDSYTPSNNYHPSTKLYTDLKYLQTSGLTAYSSSTTYNTGDYVYRSDTNPNVYRCKEDSVTGTWDNTKWELKTYFDYMKDNVGADLSNYYTKSDIDGRYGELFSVQISGLFNIDINSSKTISSDDLPLFLPITRYLHANPTATPVLFLKSKKLYSSTDAKSVYVMAPNDSNTIGNTEFYTFVASSPNRIRNDTNRLEQITLTLQYNNSTDTIVSASISKGVYTMLDLSSAQTISGVKTFSSLPESSVVPTTDNQLVNKKYVDDAITSAIADALGGSY